jgi:hypothetical protein
MGTRLRKTGGLTEVPTSTCKPVFQPNPGGGCGDPSCGFWTNIPNPHNPSPAPPTCTPAPIGLVCKNGVLLLCSLEQVPGASAPPGLCPYHVVCRPVTGSSPGIEC